MRERVTVTFTVVTLSVCLSQTDFEDGIVLSLQTGIKAWQVTVSRFLNKALFLIIDPNLEK